MKYSQLQHKQLFSVWISDEETYSKVFFPFSLSLSLSRFFKVAGKGQQRMKIAWIFLHPFAIELHLSFILPPPTHTHSFAKVVTKKWKFRGEKRSQINYDWFDFWSQTLDILRTDHSQKIIYRSKPYVNSSNWIIEKKEQSLTTDFWNKVWAVKNLVNWSIKWKFEPNEGCDVNYNSNGHPYWCRSSQLTYQLWENSSDFSRWLGIFETVWAKTCAHLYASHYHHALVLNGWNVAILRSYSLNVFWMLLKLRYNGNWQWFLYKIICLWIKLYR